jgi:PQQ-dependent dehydrogenase (methanol/ethanol family)
LAIAAVAPVHADDANCCTAPGKDFPKVGGNFGNQNYTALSQINKATVGRLGAAWHLNLEGGAKNADQQASVVVADGVIFAETTQGNVYAVDGKTGQIKWSYKGGFGNQIRRGLALGGGKVYAAFGGFHVAALDQKTGALVWVKELPKDGVGGSLKTAIVYYDGMIYLGTADAARGAAWAIDAGTGALAWKFFGAPGSGEFGSDTWEGDSWKTGGATPWMHPAIDPELGLVYFTFGNARAGAPTDGSSRGGQNLFANSLVALDAKTGKRAWHFQSVHHDIRDMDNVMAPVLADVPVAGKTRKIIVYGSKTGMFYVLDRTNGEPITPIIETPVPQQPLQKTWPTQPIPVGDALSPQCPNGAAAATKVPPNYQYGCLFTPHLSFPVVQAPGTAGGMDWNALSFNPKTKLIYTGVGLIMTAHIQYNGGVGFRPLGENRSGKVVAFNPATHKIVWQKDTMWSLDHGNGILTTGGDVMFVGQPDGEFVALDMTNGNTLWQFQTGAGVHTSPAAYEIGGEEYVAVFAGGNFNPYNSPRGDDLWAFKLGGKVAQAAAPTPPSQRQPITSTPVEGSVVKDTVNIARLWSASGMGAAESLDQNAMAPQALRVPAGTTVTFVNPAGNAQPHCVMQFYEGLFSSPPLNPGQSFAYKFLKPGEYFYNDCTSPQITGKIIVY